MIFVNKGDKPLTTNQLEKRAQKYITRAFPMQRREESIRKADGEFDTFMTAFSTDHETNKTNNTFNWQLQDYTKAVARLAQYQVALGRPELTEEVVVDQQFNEETGEMEDVTETQVTQTAIEPVEPTVEQTVYGDDPEAEPTVETIENPLITQDNAERAAAQAVVDATPQEVKDFS
jgi:hypothetical protein